MIDWKCVFVGSRKDAEQFVVQLAWESIPARLLADNSTRRAKPASAVKFHVAVPVEHAGTPRVWLLTVRGSDKDAVCTGNATIQHATEVQA